MNDFAIYSYVKKRTGYKFPGMVMAKFYTRAGVLRYVVEAIDENYTGMLHIFNDSQLVPLNDFETETKAEAEISTVVKGRKCPCGCWMPDKFLAD
jgi:hypothetical protein